MIKWLLHFIAMATVIIIIMQDGLATSDCAEEFMGGRERERLRSFKT